MTTINYNLGIILEKNSNRLELKLDDSSILINFLLSSNFISNINISYLEIDFNKDNSYEIVNKFQNYANTNVWITALRGDKVKRIIDAYFSMYIFRRKLLISTCDELDETVSNQNVWHVNSTKKSIIGAIINIFRNKIINNYDYLYVFYNNSHASHIELFKNYWVNILTKVTTHYVNIDNPIEKINSITNLVNDKKNEILTPYNTAFLYFSDTLEIFFEIYSKVEDPSLINTFDFISEMRHYNYYTSYINTDYITILDYMKKYLSPSFIINDNYDEFFYNNLRCYVITQSLTQYQNEKLSYLKYIYYKKNTQISSDYLKNNRISIYTILIEKALILAKEFLYRNIKNTQIYQNTLLIEERLFGHLNSELINNDNDKNYFMRNLFITTPIEHLYDILNPINKFDKDKNIISTVSININ
jgi:hypothetical protein